MRRATRTLWVIALFAVIARVFTGAAEAQVNFGNLLIQKSSISHEITSLETSVTGCQESASNASQIPDSQKNFKSYKKYLPPKDKFVVSEENYCAPVSVIEKIGFTETYRDQSPLIDFRSHSPPSLNA